MTLKILDACCGSRMAWYDKDNPLVMFMDNRQIDETLCDGRRLIVCPDVVGDFRHMPFPDESFYLVFFDPPHMSQLGADSWTAKKYGVLLPTWRDEARKEAEEWRTAYRNKLEALGIEYADKHKHLMPWEQMKDGGSDE
ncbi:hypothetical protein [Pyramidobacter piscolens]|uniref:hypothetical protein n=1 Tax=Pyramidobacter piscolens TaxID=638849 RepID=UPI001FCBEB87|nr:hypothetical protein [Pyramidobacter piscolens]BDF78614.1 hypothetical protein CE91St28_14080 [Pyramidobacter piscolens]